MQLCDLKLLTDKLVLAKLEGSLPVKFELSLSSHFMAGIGQTDSWSAKGSAAS